MSIVLKICLHGTPSKMGQLQRQWVHILKMNKINFKYKGCYQAEIHQRSQTCSQRLMSTAYIQAIDYRMQIAAFISLHAKYTHTQKEGTKER